MAKNIANLLTEILKRAGVSVEERKSLKAVLENTEISKIEIDEDDYTAVMGNLHNLETAKAQLTPTIKAESLNGVDSLIDELWDDLSDTQKAELKKEKNTTQKLKKAHGYTQENLKEAIKKAQKGGDDATVASLKDSLDKVNADFKSAKQTFEDEKATLVASHKKELFNEILKQKSFSRSDIAKEKKDDRHFARNFVSDFEEHLQKLGVEIDPETKEILKKDKTPYFDKNQNKPTFDDLLGEVVKSYGYEKKSETVATTVIELPKNNEPLSQMQAITEKVKERNRKANL